MTINHSQPKPIATKTAKTEMISEGSWGHRDLGKHKWTMELYDTPGDAGHGYIEWDIPSIDGFECIGLTYEMRGDKRALVEYDGVMSLPSHAAELLEEAGIIVDEDFK